jgi:hypothetical protein
MDSDQMSKILVRIGCGEIPKGNHFPGNSPYVIRIRNENTGTA